MESSMAGERQYNGENATDYDSITKGQEQKNKLEQAGISVKDGGIQDGRQYYWYQDPETGRTGWFSQPVESTEQTVDSDAGLVVTASQKGK